MYRYMKGSIEILCGIKLNSVFTEHIHSLANRLTIYKLRLLSQDRRHKYCLGGSVPVMLEMEAKFPEFVDYLSEVYRGLAIWRKHNQTLLQYEI